MVASLGIEDVRYHPRYDMMRLAVACHVMQRKMRFKRMKRLPMNMFAERYLGCLRAAILKKEAEAANVTKFSPIESVGNDTVDPEESLCSAAANETFDPEAPSDIDTTMDGTEAPSDMDTTMDATSTVGFDSHEIRITETPDASATGPDGELNLLSPENTENKRRTEEAFQEMEKFLTRRIHRTQQNFIATMQKLQRVMIVFKKLIGEEIVLNRPESSFRKMIPNLFNKVCTKAWWRKNPDMKNWNQCKEFTSLLLDSITEFEHLQSIKEAVMKAESALFKKVLKTRGKVFGKDLGSDQINKRLAAIGVMASELYSLISEKQRSIASTAICW